MNATKPDLWQIQISLGNYTPDLHEEFVLNLPKMQKRIPLEDYLTNLYAERIVEGFERNLEYEMLSAARILCVVGERGAGKTSALEFVRMRMKKRFPEVHFERLDLKRLYDPFYSAMLQEAKEATGTVMEAYGFAFKLLLRYSLVNVYFPDPRSYRDLIIWALSGRPDESERFDPTLVYEFDELHRIIVGGARARCEISTRQVRKEAIRKYFESEELEYESFMKEVGRRLLPAHIIQCFLSNHPNIFKVLLVLDNIDRVPLELQSTFLLACRDTRMRIGPRCSITVAIRTENVRRREFISGDDQFFDVIEPDGSKYTGLLLPKIEAAHMERVFQMREAYAQASLEEHDRTFHSALAAEHARTVAGYHRYVVTEFVENAVYALSNDSYRALLRVYIEFMRYIWTLVSRNLITLSRLEEQGVERHLQTLFWVWLQEKGPDLGIPVHNIIDNHYPIDASTPSEIASAEHLLLTCIHNMMRERGAGNVHNFYPTWREVVARMKTLGFDYPRIRKALSEFLTPVGQAAGALQFVQVEMNAEDVDENCAEEISLTSLGRELVLNILHKFGYVWGVASRNTELNIPRLHYLEFTRRDRARHVYEYSKLLARKHLRFLSMIAASWHISYGDNWMHAYRQQFGVNGFLQVERILVSAANFFDNLFAQRDPDAYDREIHNPFVIMARNYSVLIAEVSSLNAYDHLNFERLNSGDALILEE